MMAVSIDTEGEFEAGTPEPLFSLRDYVFPGIRGRQYDVAPDGRFLMIKDVETTDRAPRQIAIIQNWFEELNEMVPVD